MSPPLYRRLCVSDLCRARVSSKIVKQEVSSKKCQGRVSYKSVK